MQAHMLHKQYTDSVTESSGKSATSN